MSLREAEAVVSKPAEKSVTKVEWDKDGEGLLTFEGSKEVPSDEDIRALILRIGKDPDDYNWAIVSVSWNSAAWHRDSDGIGLNHTAYTKPACVVKIRIDPKIPLVDGVVPWPVVQPSKPFVVKHRPPTKVVKTTDDFKTCVVMPDMQIGFYFDASGEMHPTHDDRAIDVAFQILKYVKPDLLIFNGDNLDLPEMSKYRLTPAFAKTTQATIDRCGLLAAESRESIGPDGEIRWLEGNHEIRLSNYILDNAKAAFGLKQANAPESWPVLSVPNLCRFDEHDIQYISGYPANETWINERLRVIHGTHVVSGGSTAHKYLNNDRVSTIYGHIHRREWAERTRANFGGPQTILALSAGCLARIDGSVPSTKGGNDLDGVPVSVVEDWQQGVAVVTYREGNGEFIPEQVPIWDGWAMYHGKHFFAA